MKWRLAALVLAASAFACSPPQQKMAAQDSAAPDAAVYGLAAPEVASAPAEEAPVAKEAPLALTPMLAYEYAASIRLPVRSVEPLMRQHEQRCVQAGPAKCQVIGSSAFGDEEDKRAALTIRADPEWLKSFRAGLDSDAKKADGEIVNLTTTSEDLTRFITDTQARVRSLETLQARLEQLLASRPGKLAELLELERELARVRGELDSLKSELAVARARVAMSKLELSYETRVSAVTRNAMAPIGDALNGFVAVVAGGFAIIITMFAAILPFAIVLGPLLWLGWRAWRKRKAKPAAPALTPEQPNPQ